MCGPLKRFFQPIDSAMFASGETILIGKKFASLCPCREISAYDLFVIPIKNMSVSKRRM